MAEATSTRHRKSEASAHVLGKNEGRSEAQLEEKARIGSLIAHQLSELGAQILQAAEKNNAQQDAHNEQACEGNCARVHARMGVFGARYAMWVGWRLASMRGGVLARPNKKVNICPQSSL